MPDYGAWICPVSNTKLLVVPLPGKEEQTQGVLRSGASVGELSGGFCICQRVGHRVVNKGGSDTTGGEGGRGNGTVLLNSTLRRN